MSERAGEGRGGRGAGTRQRILDAAERLMAERGIEGVSLNEINGAAGQRSTASLHYHFGGREGLLKAVMQRHGPWLRARHEELYAALVSEGGEDDVRALAEVIVLPLAEYLALGPSPRAAIRIWASALNRPRLTVEEVQYLVDPALTEASRRLIVLMSRSMPRELAVERLFLASQSALHVLADRAALEDAPDNRRRLLPLPLMTANLVDMTVAALTAPVGAQTARIAASVFDPASA
ncbi:TetR/AcrR family transcriptional regulator [Actinocorallia populi]|uniref:TetR/AcrR family transcriptional regulator n=1 Tax=Actinocorallia populi TaxID=2079200 RepID=UPI00130062D5|nr:TetR/AcrR family transcriptional regulator [Actinocorallia populi]